VFDDPDAVILLDRLEALLQFLLPCYERERRSYLTIGIGCTGGRHRSVAIALRLRDRLAKAGCITTLRHRDLAKS
jgi:RNase adapter protein RapZ